MNYNIIKQYIQAYKDQFDDISKKELYKWKAVAHFQKHWDIDATDFPAMLEESLKITKNLLVSFNYFPLAMMRQFVRREPEKVRDAFKDVFDLEIPLEERFDQFQNVMEKIRARISDAKSHFQDHRAFTVYLSMQYPEDYFLYKYGMFDKSAKIFDFPYSPKKGAFSNITKFYSLCNLITPILLKKDDELLRLHHQRLNDDLYQDPAYHLLTQDFIYACVTHINLIEIEESEKDGEIEIEELDISQFISELSAASFKGRQIDYVERDKRNSSVGNAAEVFVFSLEKKRLKQLGLDHKVTHTSVEEGDGKGYDIESVNQDNETIYIEVKATTGNFLTPFYITRNEMQWSIKNPHKYKLYRVYDFDIKTGIGKLKILSGSLEHLCQQPVNYFIKLKENQSNLN